MFRKLQENIRYLVDKAFARKFVGQSLLFLTLVVTATLIGMTACSLKKISLSARSHVTSMPVSGIHCGGR